MAGSDDFPKSTPPNYTCRDDDETTLHQQKLDSTGLADTIPRILVQRGKPLEADLEGPEGQYIGWDGI
jgi:hypothetical protein